MIVSFVGLPGCGKSTQRVLLAEHLVAAGYIVHQAARLRATPSWASRLPGALGRAAGSLAIQGSKLRTALGQPGAVVALLTAMAADPRPLRDRMTAIRLVLTTLDNVRFGRSLPPGHVAIVSEGVVQRSFLLFVDGRGVHDGPRANRWFRAAPTCDVMVHLRSDSHEDVRRLAGRERGLPPRFAGIDDEALTKLLTEAEAFFADGIERSTAGRAGAAHEEVDAEGDREEVAARVLEALEPHLPRLAAA